MQTLKSPLLLRQLAGLMIDMAAMVGAGMVLHWILRR